MLRLTFLLVLLSALFGVSENVVAQSPLGEIEPIGRPQLEQATLEDLLDPNFEMDDDPETDNEASDSDAKDSDSTDGDAPDSEASSDDEDDDLDFDLEPEAEELKPQRLTDDRIRNNWPKHSMSEIDLSLVEVGRVPEDRSELLDGYGRVGPVSESVKVFAWEAPNIRYQPLYFEDVVLERYGQTLTDYRQGIRSAIRFGTALTGLSLQMLETEPRSCDHPLGYCRPGTCVPQTTQRHFFGALSLR